MNTENTIRLNSQNGDVDEVVEQLRLLSKTFGNLGLSCAEICTTSPWDISSDPESENHYTLRLKSKLHGGLTILVSEVRTGYAGASVEAMYECLRIAGFTLSGYISDSIRNKLALKATVWKEEPFGSIARY